MQVERTTEFRVQERRRMMVSEAVNEASSAPKLSLFSLPNQSPEPQGMLTPPLRPPASVPFLWEEAPGKPRNCTETDSKPKSSSARCLELPPRLLLPESKITNMPSPTTVLEGPYILGRSASCSVSFSRDRRSSSPPESGGRGGQSEGVFHHHGKKEYSKERSEGGGGGGGGGYFGSWGRNNNKKQSLKGNEEVAVEDNFVISRSATTTTTCSSSHPPSLCVLKGEEGREEDTSVKITRFRRRRGSFLSLSSTTSSHFWARMYGTLKQVVPWRRISSRKNKN